MERKYTAQTLFKNSFFQIANQYTIDGEQELNYLNTHKTKTQNRTETKPNRKRTKKCAETKQKQNRTEKNRTEMEQKQNRNRTKTEQKQNRIKTGKEKRKKNRTKQF